MSSLKRFIIPVFFYTLLITAAALWYFSSLIILFETRGPEEHRLELGIQSYADFGLDQATEVNWAGNAGLKLSGAYVPGKSGCGVVFLHGYRGSRYGMLKYARLFKGDSCALLFWDAPRHGGSSGRVTTYGVYEKAEVVKTLSWFAATTGLAFNQIGLVGESMGAAMAVQAAAMEPLNGRVAFVLLDSPFASLYDILLHQGIEQYGSIVSPLSDLAFALASFRSGVDLYQASPEEAAGRLKNIPVYVSHSAADRYTPPGHSRRIFARLRVKKKHLIMTDWNSSHARSIDDQPGRYTSDFRAFLTGALPAWPALPAKKSGKLSG